MVSEKKFEIENLDRMLENINEDCPGWMDEIVTNVALLGAMHIQKQTKQQTILIFYSGFNIAINRRYFAKSE